MRVARIFVLLILAGCGGYRMPVSGGDEVGNGGDSLEALFVRGRKKASRILDVVKEIPASDDAGGSLRAFYRGNRDALRTESEKTPMEVWGGAPIRSLSSYLFAD